MLLVTGGTGYIGQKVLPLLAKTEKVLVLSRKHHTFSDKNITSVEGDLLDPATLQGTFSGVTKVLHMASITHAYDTETYWRVNVEGTKNLLNALPKNIEQFVYTSTTSAAIGAGGYGESKLAVEQLIKERFSRSRYVILRIGDVYGGAGEKSLEQLFAKIKSSLVVPLIGDGHYKMAPVHVDDVMLALAKSIDVKESQTLVVTGLEHFTFKELVTTVAALSNKKPFLLPIPTLLLEPIIIILAALRIGEYYPDQVKRFIVKKDLDSTTTWKVFKHKPLLLSDWLKLSFSSPQY